VVHFVAVRSHDRTATVTPPCFLFRMFLFDEAYHVPLHPNSLILFSPLRSNGACVLLVFFCFNFCCNHVIRIIELWWIWLWLSLNHLMYQMAQTCSAFVFYFILVQIFIPHFYHVLHTFLLKLFFLLSKNHKNIFTSCYLLIYFLLSFIYLFCFTLLLYFSFHLIYFYISCHFSLLSF